MKKTIKRLTAYVFAAVLLLPCIPAFAESVQSVVWTADTKTVTLSDTPDGSLSTINLSSLNSVKVYFTGGNTEHASFIIVPVTDGAAEEPTSENVALMMQQPVTDGVADFSFQLKPTTPNGVYALYTGGTDTGYMKGYFEVNDNAAPTLVEGQIFQYDDYKNSIDLKFSVGSNVDFEGWAADKSKMNVMLSNGTTRVTINPDLIRFDTEEKIMSISAQGYADIMPAFGASIEGNIQDAEISITTPGYWVGDEYGGTITEAFKMVMPEFSAEGFKQGVDFEIELYSDNELNGANAIAALYDDGLLVDFAQVENISIAAGATQPIELTMQSENLSESGKFSLKVMLWDGFSAEPLTSFVVFP